MSDAPPKLVPVTDNILRSVNAQLATVFPGCRFGFRTSIQKDDTFQIAVTLEDGSQAAERFFAQGAGSTHLEAAQALQEHTVQMLHKRAEEHTVTLALQVERTGRHIKTIVAAQEALA